jgi:hypothetical protein
MSATTAWYCDGRGITLRISPSQRSASSPGNTPRTNPGFKRLPLADEMTAPRTTTFHITGPAIANIFRECCHRPIVESLSASSWDDRQLKAQKVVQIDNVEFERLLPGSSLPKENNRKTTHGKRPVNGCVLRYTTLLWACPYYVKITRKKDGCCPSVIARILRRWSRHSFSGYRQSSRQHR